MDNKLQVIYDEACQANGKLQKLTETWRQKICRLDTKIRLLKNSLGEIIINLEVLENDIKKCEKERIRYENESKKFSDKAKVERNKRNDSAFKGAFKLGAGAGASIAAETILAPLTGGASMVLGAVVDGVATGLGTLDFADAFAFDREAKKCDSKAKEYADESSFLTAKRKLAEEEKKTKEQEKAKYTKKRDDKQLEMDLLDEVSRKLDSIKTNIKSIETTAIAND